MVLPMFEEVLAGMSGFWTGAGCSERSTRPAAEWLGLDSTSCRRRGEESLQGMSCVGLEVSLGVECNAGMAWGCGMRSLGRGSLGGEDEKFAAVMAATSCEYTYPALGDVDSSREH